MTQAIELPQDLASAHALILQMHARLHEMQGEIVDLRHRLDVMARRMFGRRSEQLDPAQLELAFQALLAEEEQAQRETEGEEAESDAGDESEHPPRPRRKGHGRRRPPQELPRETRVIEPESTTCACGCGGVPSLQTRVVTGCRHNEGANIGFCDGHGKWMAWNTISFRDALNHDSGPPGVNVWY